jgi:hypothetical protein
LSLSAEVHVEHQSRLVVLLVGALAGAVLVLVIRVELEVFADGEVAAGVDCRVAPFALLALVIELGTGAGRWMVGAESESPFELDPIAVTPTKGAALPVEVSAVAV